LYLLSLPIQRKVGLGDLSPGLNFPWSTPFLITVILSGLTPSLLTDSARVVSETAITLG